MKLLDPYELNLLRRYDVIPAEVLGPIADEIGFGLPRWQRRGYAVSVLLFSLCIIFLVVWKLGRGRSIDTVEWVLWPLNLGVFGLSAVQFWRSGRRARANRICAVLLAHRRCPHCGYDLRLLPDGLTDGATVCPECGCAWKLSGPQAHGLGARAAPMTHCRTAGPDMRRPCNSEEKQRRTQ